MNAGKDFNMSDCFAGAKIITLDGVFDCKQTEWAGHPEYPGVELKALLADELTNNKLRSMLVQVAPGCSLFEHIHEDNWEMHEVIAGTGRSTLESSAGEYAPGTIAIIPAGVKHSVQAGEDGLVLLAKFF